MNTLRYTMSMLNPKTSTELYSRLLGFRSEVEDLRTTLISYGCIAAFELRIDQVKEAKIKSLINGLSTSIEFFKNYVDTQEYGILSGLTFHLMDVNLAPLLRGEKITYKYQTIDFPADHLLYEVKSSLIDLINKPRTTNA